MISDTAWHNFINELMEYKNKYYPDLSITESDVINELIFTIHIDSILKSIEIRKGD